MGKRTVTIENLSAWDCYIGDAAVTHVNGYLLKAGSTPLVVSLALGDSLFGIGAVNTPVVSWIEGKSS